MSRILLSQPDITALIGNHVTFNYPRAFGSLPDYTQHAGQTVLVLRELDESEADGPAQGCEQMFKIRAADGWEGDAWVSEMSTPGAVTAENTGWGS